MLAAGGTLGFGEKMLAVPYSAFTQNPTEDHLVLRADKSSITAAEGFEKDNWPALQDPAFGAVPFWKESGEHEGIQT